MVNTAAETNGTGKTALVTGATGFIGAHVCSRLLKAGWAVRAAARTQTRADKLKEALVQLHSAEEAARLHMVLVPDMVEPGAYAEAVRDVHVIFHLAAICQLFSVTPLTVFNAAVQGTKSLLDSALRHGNKLNRFVNTSSSGAVYDFGLKGYEMPDEYIYTEEDWNHTAVQYTLAQGDQAFPVIAYLAAKTQSEWDLWEFMKQNNPTWDAVSLNPPFVYGPILMPCDTAHDLNDSIEILYTFCSQVKPREFLRPRMRFDDFIDVRDCAEYHLLAATKTEAGGKRFICNVGPVSDNAIARIIKKHFPTYGATITETGWNESEDQTLPVTSSTKSMRETLGTWSYIDVETSVVDSVKSIQVLLEKERAGAQ